MKQILENTDFEVRSLDEPVTDSLAAAGSQDRREPGWYSLKYLLAGVVFGIILVKSEVISWFRIQEMFRLQSFHMYGVIGSAVVVGIVSVQLIKRLGIKTVSGEPIRLAPRKFQWGQVFGGLLFGLGWAITGACPGPLFAQIGSGFTVVIVTLLSAIAGTWVYGSVREKLPH
ncbi:MAG: YeeE/YedE thiosulfate transporter family protein [Puia sp.]|nr:YeeE/YedE thiosulfate transporter family protein [Puia sp.]